MVIWNLVCFVILCIVVILVDDGVGIFFIDYVFFSRWYFGLLYWWNGNRWICLIFSGISIFSVCCIFFWLSVKLGINGKCGIMLIFLFISKCRFFSMCGRFIFIIFCVWVVFIIFKLNSILLYNFVSGNSLFVGVFLVVLMVYDIFYSCSCCKKWVVNFVCINILLLESVMLLLDVWKKMLFFIIFCFRVLRLILWLICLNAPEGYLFVLCKYFV